MDSLRFNAATPAVEKSSANLPPTVLQRGVSRNQSTTLLSGTFYPCTGIVKQRCTSVRSLTLLIGF